jgi:hypothetical protein
MNGNTFEDAEIVCANCGETFIWSAGQQQFYQDRNLSKPKPARRVASCGAIAHSTGRSESDARCC